MSLTDFTLLSKIGEGSFSSVHKVKRISDGHVYALKKVTGVLTIGETDRLEGKIKVKCSE